MDGAARFPRPIPLFPWALVGLTTVPMAAFGPFADLWIWPPVLVGDADYYAAAIPTASTGNVQPLLVAVLVTTYLLVGIDQRAERRARTGSVSP
jgi:hypothetical protein